MIMKIELKQIQENPEILEELSLKNQDLIITKNDKPIFQLIRIGNKRRHRGSAEGLITMSPDFDEPLPDFAEYQ